MKQGWQILKVRRICHRGELYLWRLYLVSCAKFGVMVHRFYRPDSDRVLHDHPWKWAIVVHLWGGYVETHPVKARSFAHTRTRRFAPSIRLLRGKDLHKIETLSKPGRVWTLFIHGPRVREWGFQTATGWEPWHSYLVRTGAISRAAAEKRRARFASGNEAKDCNLPPP